MNLMRLSSLVVSVGLLACGGDDRIESEPQGLPSAQGDSGTLPNMSGGGGDGGTQTTTPGGGNGIPNGTACEVKAAQAGPIQPDMMIVLDRSGSMQQGSLNCKGAAFPSGNWFQCVLAGIDCNNPDDAKMSYCGGPTAVSGDRWTPAVKGLKSITSQFQDKVAFGLTTFPGPGQQSQSSCVAGVQNVAVKLNSATEISTALDAIKPEGNTPTGPTLQAVLKAVQGKKGTPDELVPPQYVLLVTDGQPTCPGNGNTPKAETIKALDALRAAGVKTYVIGYDASVNAGLAASLTEFAQHGGTNNFYPVQDEASLVAKFKEITGAVASCSYQLDHPPANPDFVKVTIDDQQIYLNKGFTLSGANVSIDGAACDTLRDGKVHKLVVTVECTTQVIL